jgi:hypothetical protein
MLCVHLISYVRSESSDTAKIWAMLKAEELRARRGGFVRHGEGVDACDVRA